MSQINDDYGRYDDGGYYDDDPAYYDDYGYRDQSYLDNPNAYPPGNPLAQDGYNRSRIDPSRPISEQIDPRDYDEVIRDPVRETIITEPAGPTIPIQGK